MRTALFALALIAAPALADSNLPPAALANTQLSDAGQEARARALMGEIRCMVCDGQSIADSDAELAGDMRALIREKVRSGERPEAIRDWLISRYGEAVSYRPAVEGATLALWLAPLLVLGGGALLATRRFKRRR